MIHTVYIAGPMSGRTFSNMVNFCEAEIRLVDKGCIVFNPIISDLARGMIPEIDQRDITTAEKPDIIIRDLRLISKCDMIVLLDGWEESKGVTVELAFADFVGIPYTPIGEFLSSLST